MFQAFPKQGTLKAYACFGNAAHPCGDREDWIEIINLPIATLIKKDRNYLSCSLFTLGKNVCGLPAI
jgi:hypothetical protein